MPFLPQLFEPVTCNYDQETIDLVKKLEGTGAAVSSKDHPTLQPQLETLKSKKLPIAWIIMSWGINIVGTDENIIVEYVTEGKYQFDPTNYTELEINELIRHSYQQHAVSIRQKLKELGLQPAIPPLHQDELDDSRLHILEFFAEKGI